MFSVFGAQSSSTDSIYTKGIIYSVCLQRRCVVPHSGNLTGTLDTLSGIIPPPPCPPPHPQANNSASVQMMNNRLACNFHVTEGMQPINGLGRDSYTLRSVLIGVIGGGHSQDLGPEAADYRLSCCWYCCCCCCWYCCCCCCYICCCYCCYCC